MNDNYYKIKNILKNIIKRKLMLVVASSIALSSCADAFKFNKDSQQSAGKPDENSIPFVDDQPDSSLNMSPKDNRYPFRQRKKGDPIKITYGFKLRSPTSPYESLITGIPGIPETAVRDNVAKALQAWADVAPLHFYEVPDTDDYNQDIFFAKFFQQSDAMGYGGGGVVVLNKKFTFTPALFQGALTHEIGHELVLMHDNAAGAMFPYCCRAFNARDKQLIQEQYGAGVGKVYRMGDPLNKPSIKLTFEESKESQGRLIWDQVEYGRLFFSAKARSLFYRIEVKEKGKDFGLFSKVKINLDNPVLELYGLEANKSYEFRISDQTDSKDVISNIVTVTPTVFKPKAASIKKFETVKTAHKNKILKVKKEIFDYYTKTYFLSWIEQTNDVSHFYISPTQAKSVHGERLSLLTSKKGEYFTDYEKIYAGDYHGAVILASRDDGSTLYLLKWSNVTSKGAADLKIEEYSTGNQIIQIAKDRGSSGEQLAWLETNENTTTLKFLESLESLNKDHIRDLASGEIYNLTVSPMRVAISLIEDGVHQVVQYKIPYQYTKDTMLSKTVSKAQMGPVFSGKIGTLHESSVYVVERDGEDSVVKEFIDPASANGIYAAFPYQPLSFNPQYVFPGGFIHDNNICQLQCSTSYGYCHQLCDELTPVPASFYAGKFDFWNGWGKRVGAWRHTNDQIDWCSGTTKSFRCGSTPSTLPGQPIGLPYLFDDGGTFVEIYESKPDQFELLVTPLDGAKK
jgi:hypothetical protein